MKQLHEKDNKRVFSKWREISIGNKIALCRGLNVAVQDLKIISQINY